MTKQTFTKEELLNFNEIMLGRGMPVTEDGIGYNKADFGACSTYFYGVSNAQLTDLAKRLVKYCNTQLGVDKEMMKDTFNELAELSKDEDRRDGISIDIRENGTLISFAYNEEFVGVIKAQKRRQYDAETKNWIVPNDTLIDVLRDLGEFGADVDNALSYAMDSEIIVNAVIRKEVGKVEVLTKLDGDYAFLKFKYNQSIVNEIKKIDTKDRQWNTDFKFWLIDKKHYEGLKEKLSNVATFKLV